MPLYTFVHKLRCK